MVHWTGDTHIDHGGCNMCPFYDLPHQFAESASLEGADRLLVAPCEARVRSVGGTDRGLNVRASNTLARLPVMRKATSQAKPYLTPTEVATMLRISPATVRLWSQRGDLAFETTPGGHRRYRLEDIFKFAHAHRINLHADDQQELRVLIVEDDPYIAAFLTDALLASSDQIGIETAQTGFEAGNKIHTFQPIVVLLDLMLPGVDGIEVCRSIKTDPMTQHIRVIAITGYFSDENRARMLAAGAESFLPKPLTMAELRGAIGLRQVPRRNHT